MYMYHHSVLSHINRYNSEYVKSEIHSKQKVQRFKNAKGIWNKRLTHFLFLLFFVVFLNQIIFNVISVQFLLFKDSIFHGKVVKQVLAGLCEASR